MFVPCSWCSTWAKWAWAWAEWEFNREKWAEKKKHVTVLSVTRVSSITFTKTGFSSFGNTKLAAHLTLGLECKQTMFLYKIKDNLVTIV